MAVQVNMNFTMNEWNLAQDIRKIEKEEARLKMWVQFGASRYDARHGIERLEPVR